MGSGETSFREKLASFRQRGLERFRITFEGRTPRHLSQEGRLYVSFASNDYLGLSCHPRVREKSCEAVEKFGAGAGASPLVCGQLGLHTQLEEEIARWKGTEAACLFSSGYAAALGTIRALVGPGDLVVLDEFSHASLWDGARLSRALVRVFSHSDLDALQRVLTRYSKKNRRILVVAESVYSMDGDVAPLQDLVELKDRYGAWLLLDEAHATGIYGKAGAGLGSELGVASRIEFHLGTLGKVLGSMGAYVAASREVIQWLLHSARSLMYSTALSPAMVAAALEALKILHSEEGARRRNQLWDNIRFINPDGSSAILPIVVGAESKAMEMASRLQEEGFYVPAIRYPTVPRGKARLRISVTSEHKPADMAGLLAILRHMGICP
ncbi:aminotransferase class I/II-fold pyridoxal phosphate-dependent enzyme [Candidatus Methylacidithermus pantelleriae]|uniref:8-amino-7-oxononanoate synthase n=1 Tax=Candidatus Methylacidithermus pantelleriae TaxID=2744239 RepID=A0A8J2BKR3_9BACT|nr:8-amino-7-oxononanoate synthase [Candidatus Methylacidithermus pantelleriae]CAF0697198.1 8-amino-7-oxononanoate synthase [Candidatus Methylacidithermus pantelleriae]